MLCFLKFLKHSIEAKKQPSSVFRSHNNKRRPYVDSYAFFHPSRETHQTRCDDCARSAPPTTRFFIDPALEKTEIALQRRDGAHSRSVRNPRGGCGVKPVYPSGLAWLSCSHDQASWGAIEVPRFKEAPAC